ncbi:outer membrane protein [Vogesella sp. LIG4]|uniref:outer membrane protein n=1 Tax=Vogesella sp. LIG4 TaxID=1192162 RepID=UPI00081F91DD|nr:outer membrane beta-barrel protein [Vogesella sp. LIG4]SCK24257.1 outer membrane insertion C-terminal signal [Vogesella sp. LIG4]
MKKVFALAAFAVLSSGAFAGGFDGVYAEAAIGYAHSKTDVDGTAPSQNSTVGKLTAGYSQAFNQFNLAGNAYFIIGDQKAGSVSGSDGTFTGTVDSKGTDTWGLSIEPGINLNDNALVYAKLGYAQTTGKIEVNGTYNGAPVSGSASTTFHGFSYGVGAKYKFSSNLYGVVEIQQIDYRSKDGVKPSTFMSNIGIGYKF